MHLESLIEQTAESELYRHMVCSQGGLVLLIRLRANLDRCPLEWLRGIAVDVERSDLDEYPGVVSAFAWLDRKFGRANAVRAVEDTVAEILDAQAG
jgi:hypothetical protein